MSDLLTVLASPTDDCKAALLEQAQGATASLHQMIYGFTLKELAALFVQKHQAGLSVGGLYDHSQSADPAELALLKELVAAGLETLIGTAPTGALIHTKALFGEMVLGADHPSSWVAFGSFNFSYSAQRQDNVLVITNNAVVCQALWNAYQTARLWTIQHQAKFQLQGAILPPVE